MVMVIKLHVKVQKILKILSFFKVLLFILFNYFYVYFDLI